MKKLRLLLVMAMSCVALVGCSSNKLSDAFNEEELKTASQNIIQEISNKEYTIIEETASKEFEDAGVVDKIKEVWEPILADLGEFDSYEKEAVVGEDNQATVVTIAKFKNGKAQFTIGYNEDMGLTAFYIK